MRQYRGPNGEERIWFEPSEIEQMMESELRKAKLMPTLETPAVNLEKFVERHLNAQLDHYAELEPAVLGVTEFFVQLAYIDHLNRLALGVGADGVRFYADGKPGTTTAAQLDSLIAALVELGQAAGTLPVAAQTDARP